MQRTRSFDQFVSANEERQRHVEPERLGGLEIDNQLDLGGLLHGEISRFRSFEDSVNVEGSPAIHVDVIWAIPDQCALPPSYRKGEYRRQSRGFVAESIIRVAAGT